LTAESDDELDDNAFGMILDKADPEFDTGTGRQFLIKWSHLPYSESTHEFERGLIVNDIDYKEQVKSYLRRSIKPTAFKQKAYLDAGESEYKRILWRQIHWLEGRSMRKSVTALNLPSRLS
jgi:hypothetical protein